MNEQMKTTATIPTRLNIFLQYPADTSGSPYRREPQAVQRLQLSGASNGEAAPHLALMTAMR